jgi:hypothetical protein
MRLSQSAFIRERVLRVYVDHYNRERPHRALKLCPPETEGDTPSGGSEIPSAGSEINRRDRLGGLIHECYRAAVSCDANNGALQARSSISAKT